MITLACMTSKETRGEFGCNVTTAGSPGRDTSTGHMKLDGCVAEIRSTSARVREAPVKFWKKKIEEAVLENLVSSDENQLAEVGELEAERRRRSTRLSQKLIAVPRLRSAETSTRRTRRRSRENR